MLKRWKLQEVLVYSLAIIVWVNNFQTPEIRAVLSNLILQVSVETGSGHPGQPGHVLSGSSGSDPV